MQAQWVFHYASLRLAVVHPLGAVIPLPPDCSGLMWVQHSRLMHVLVDNMVSATGVHCKFLRPLTYVEGQTGSASKGVDLEFLRRKSSPILRV